MQEATLPDWASSCFLLGMEEEGETKLDFRSKGPFQETNQYLERVEFCSSNNGLGVYLTMALVPALSSALQGHCLHSLQGAIISRFS